MPKVIIGRATINLTDKDYVAKGGQGTIYLKNGLIYKVYHDISGLIPENKIQELQSLSHLSNVIIPSHSIYDANTQERIGFTMPYVKNCEYLCKLFVASFKQDNNISDDMIMNLVKQMQLTLQGIHKSNIVVGDYNEMNFLTDKDFKIPYYIDVDSYQTKSYRCNAIMESVRDPLVKMGIFNQLTDWFSWAIVTFQLYTGIHPFKGKHPDYKNNELTRRMSDSISVFDKNVSVPKFITFNTVPKNQLDWYKNVFINKDRSIPPLPNAVAQQVVTNQVIDNTGTIVVDKLFEFSTIILDVVYKNGNVYILTKDGVYKGNTNIFPHTFENGRIIFTAYDDMLIITKTDKIEIYNEGVMLFTKTLENSKFKIMNNMLYEINEGGVIQYSFEKIGKIKMLPTVVSPINYNSFASFDGLMVDDIYGKYTFVIPTGYNKCYRIKVPEVNDSKIWDTKILGNILIVLFVKNGKYNCGYFKFNDDFSEYKYKIEDDVEFHNINAIIKQNGVILFNKEDDVIEIFTDLSKNKLVGNTPIRNNLKLVDANKTCFIDRNILYSITMR